MDRTHNVISIIRDDLIGPGSEIIQSLRRSTEIQSRQLDLHGAAGLREEGRSILVKGHLRLARRREMLFDLPRRRET